MSRTGDTGTGRSRRKPRWERRLGRGTVFEAATDVMRPILASVVPLLFALSACSDCCDPDPYYPSYDPRPAEIEVEVYDPVTGGVWENVGVRIVQADQEWSGRTVVSPYPDDYALTDPTGLVYFSPFSIAAYEVGFLLDAAGRAVIGPDIDEDEAYVLLEVWAPGFDAVYAEVRLTWGEPYRFVSVPFEAPPGP